MNYIEIGLILRKLSPALDFGYHTIAQDARALLQDYAVYNSVFNDPFTHKIHKHTHKNSNMELLSMVTKHTFHFFLLFIVNLSRR